MSRAVIALCAAVFATVAFGPAASAAAQHSFSCNPPAWSVDCGKSFPVASGKSIWVNFRSNAYPVGFKAYNTSGNHYLGKTGQRTSGNLKLWYNDTSRTIRVQVRASAVVPPGVYGHVSGTYWIG
ncbi:hypothetical protein [Allokutzneria albata]|uniref:Peptidase inhibitor family I36 n=1 Tax=Allokutzneria albata TaxID=211114 RepID=A0A1H0CS29_ALLAB|nr:hypothetical protein [Allokutzneria albata]SDN60700.1 hypothetical protein SAMN04489726_7393 [Allokutzneria albata]